MNIPVYFQRFWFSFGLSVCSFFYGMVALDLKNLDY